MSNADEKQNDWHTHVDYPLRVSTIYGGIVPALTNVTVSQMILHRVQSVSLCVEGLPLPKLLPKRWAHLGVDAVQLRLHCAGVYDLIVNSLFTNASNCDIQVSSERLLIFLEGKCVVEVAASNMDAMLFPYRKGDYERFPNWFNPYTEDVSFGKAHTQS